MAIKTAETEQPEMVERWLDRLSPASEKTNRFIFSKFLAWLQGKGGRFSTFSVEELVEFQKEAGNGDAFKILDEVQSYINSLKDLRLSSLETYYAVIRSFFAHNRAELPKDKTFKPRSTVAPVRGSLPPQEIRDMVLAAKPRYRAIFLSMFQSGMGQEEFSFWNLNGWKTLKEQLDSGTKVIKIDLPGRKKKKFKRTYYTFIGKDAIDAIRHYVDNLRPDREDAIFFDQYGRPVTKTAVREYWRRLSYSSGLIEPNKSTDKSVIARTRHGKGLHELRDTFRSLWSKAPAQNFVGEFIMGHEIDPQNYDKSSVDVDFYREEYLLAEDILNIMSSDRAYGKVNESEVRDLKAEIERLKNGQGEVESLRAENREIREQMSEIWQLLKKKDAEPSS